ncbi:16S rRNA (uracil(1498)-N(3))-methyltransferase [Mycoplasma leonicaptivi]|uniref:16S rRNA (uracil(1498)-N(3))-methyltransferase n=1 Tax=Mycoplasma leonicaptivi TaxID=36742 RepID=UPI0004834849|nr:16S rRNA (uracil(1498)-N(3))-methyltransferase [Mycoplasma leonicaptivi]
MNRFFVFEKEEDHFILNKDILKHLKVLRIEEEPFICVFNSEFYICKLDNQKAKIIKKLQENHEFAFEVVLAPALIKYERFEWLLQKAVELGVSKIQPIITDFTNGELYKYHKFEKKYERFLSILQNAAEQSFRNIIPILEKPIIFTDIFEKYSHKKILAHEKINFSKSISDDINENVLFLVGPEGGFSDKEVNLAIQNNVELVSLGKRILRAETASLYLLSKIKL